MIVLAIDTSTTHGSVALLADGKLLLDESFLADRSHSATMFAMLERALGMIRDQALDMVAVGLGPGSYAGVRIAIAAATGLEIGLGARPVGIPSVAALATEQPSFLVIGDARRETFYFTRVENGLCVEGPLLATESELRERIAVHPELPIFATEALPAFPDARIALPSAAKIAELAARGIGAQFGDLEPIYLREPHITKPKAVR